MKIAVFHNLPSGGAKRALYGHVKYLTQSGHIVDIYIPSTANEEFLPLEEVANNIYIFPVNYTITGLIYSTFKYAPPLVKRISLRDLENSEKKIADVINRQNYDVVFSEQDYYTGSPFLLKYIEKPLVYYSQQHPRDIETFQFLSQIPTQGESNFLTKMVINYVLNRISKIDRENVSFANYILANSYFSRENILRSYGVNSFVSYLGVDDELFGPLEVSKKDFVLSVGTCTPSKGYDFILRSLGQVDSRIRPELVIVSNYVDITWRNYLEKLADSFNVKMRILNLVEDHELVMLYNKARLVVYAPYLEPFGFVPLEAMACGTPVVGVQEGGLRETIINNKTGVLTVRDEGLFAEAVVEMLSNNKKRESLVLKALKTIKEFWTLEKAGERLLNHLNHAIDLGNLDVND